MDVGGEKNSNDMPIAFFAAGWFVVPGAFGAERKLLTTKPSEGSICTGEIRLHPCLQQEGRRSGQGGPLCAMLRRRRAGGSSPAAVQKGGRQAAANAKPQAKG
jgi:hypothetical protein